MGGIFQDFEVIHSYTRAQAIQDGVLIDVSELARQAGFRVPLVLTAAVWEHCVAWSAGEAHPQDEQGRAWDVVWMSANAARAQRRCETTNHLWFEVLVVPRGGQAPVKTVLTLHIGPGDEGEAVGTVMFPGED
jgi:hypothetical protein